MNTFAQRLKTALNKIGLSQAEAARRCDISQQSMNYIISNNLKQSKLAVTIAASLDINPNWLIYGEGKFKEKKYYEIPVLDSAYMIFKYINHDLNQDDLPFTSIDVYLGDLAFAYLIEKNKLAICCQKEYDLPSLDYLCISGISATICRTPIDDLAFSIIEWRTRYESFQFS